MNHLLGNTNLCLEASLQGLLLLRGEGFSRGDCHVDSALLGLKELPERLDDLGTSLPTHTVCSEYLQQLSRPIVVLELRANNG